MVVREKFECGVGLSSAGLLDVALREGYGSQIGIGSSVILVGVLETCPVTVEDKGRRRSSLFRVFLDVV